MIFVQLYKFSLDKMLLLFKAPLKIDMTFPNEGKAFIVIKR